MHTNGDHHKPQEPAPPARPWMLAPRQGRCRCTPLQQARREYRKGCPVHRPKTRTVTAADIGLTEAELSILQQLNAGNPPGEQQGRLERDGFLGCAEAGYIEAAGETPEDGWKLTERGLAMVITAGTFRVDPRPGLNSRFLAAALVAAGIFGVLLAAAVALVLR